MARDLEKEKRFKEGERLLRQGRTTAAVREFRALVEDSPKDLLVLNRIGDLLARHGLQDEAIGYYERIVAEFTRSGFFPRAVAILKKVLRLDPERTSAVLLLGEMYSKQNLPGEARNHLLLAADRYLRSRAVGKAREVYEKLVSLEPREPLHRVRLAEAKAAQGDPRAAAEDLIVTARELAATGRVSEAEKTYRRAGELDRRRPEPISGIARCLSSQKRIGDAIHLLEEAVNRPDVGPALNGDLLALYERAGRTEEAQRLLAGPRAVDLNDEALEEMVNVHLERGDPQAAWKRLDPVVDRLCESRRFERAVSLLVRLSRLDGQEIPALERLSRVQRAAGNRGGLAQVLERLVRACRAQSMTARAAEVLKELKEIAPRSALMAESAPRSGDSGKKSVPAEPAPAVLPAKSAGPTPRGLAGAPAPEPAGDPLAVPETQADKEFIAGHFTEAEVFEKYNLLDQATQQLHEVTRRFPGHVPAHERLVELLGMRQDREGLGEALVGLALARKAAGDMAGARQDAGIAAAQGPLPPRALAALEKAGLGATGPIAPSSTDIDSDEQEVEIVLGYAEEPETVAKAPIGASRTKAAPGDALDEITFFLEQGMHTEAAQRISALRTLGYGGVRLDDLERQAGGPTALPDHLSRAGSAARLNEEDLHSISEALEAELVNSTETAPPPTEQSLEEVFEAFKHHVAGEVGTDDFRTHYELGIAYKEMGLLDDALSEFQIASRSPALHRDACSMLGLCHRDRGEMPQAVHWYRQALRAPGSGEADLLGLRYDLADALLASGDMEGALEVFDQVLGSDPSYRDVKSRVLDLRARIRS